MEIEKLFVSLMLDAKNYTSGLSDAQREGASWSQQMRQTIGGGMEVAAAIGVAALATLAAAVVAIGVATFGLSADIASAAGRMQSELNVTTDEAARLADVAANVWGNNFATSIEDAADAVTIVRQQLGALSDDEMQRTTENAFRLRDAFGIEVTDSISAAKTLMEDFGLTSDEAFDFIASGFQRGLDRSGDFIDTIGEYSTQFANGGADAAQFFSLLESGLQGGMLGTDKAADAFKEFRLRILDGSDATREATASLFGFSGGIIDNTSAIGGINEAMLRNQVRLESLTDKQANYSDAVSEAQRALDSLEIAELTAEIDSQSTALANLTAQNGQYMEGVEGLIDYEGGVDAFFAALSDGSLSSADAFQMVVDALGSIEDPAERMQVATALMGTQFEDLGDSGALALSLIGTEMDDLAGATDAIDARYKSLPDVMEGFKRRGLMALQPIGDVLLDLANRVMPLVEDGFAVFETNVIPAIETTAAVFDSLFANLEEGMSPMDAFIEAIWDFAPPEVLDALVNFRDNILPGLMAAIMAIVTPIVTWVQNNIQLSDVLTAVGLLIASIVIPAILSIVATVAPVVAAFMLVIGAVALVRQAWTENWGGIQEKTQAVIDFIVPLINNAIAFIRTWWAENGDALLAKAREIWQGILDFISATLGFLWSGVILPLVSGIQAFWSEHGDAILAKAQITWELIKEFVRAAIEFIRNTITTVITAVQAFWIAHGETISTSAKQVWDFIYTTIQGILDTINAVLRVFIDLFKGDWEALGEDLLALWETAWDTIVNALTGLWDMIKPVLQSLWASIQSWWNGIDWSGLGKSIIDGIVAGMQAAGGAISNFLQGLINDAIGALKDLLGISSPSRVMAAAIGEPMGQGVLAGWDRALGNNRLEASLSAAVAGLGSGNSYSSQTTVQLAPGQDPLRALRASRHLDKLGVSA